MDGYQGALNDVGWTIPAVAACYWVGEAMGSTDFKDLMKTPDKVGETAKMVAANTVHLAPVEALSGMSSGTRQSARNAEETIS